jgi:hypothetical protein
MDRLSVGEIVLRHSLRYVPVIVVFAGLATVTAGCSDSRMAANNAASNSGESFGERTGYGMRSDGYTTDMATELKGSLQRAPRPQTAAASGPVQQGQPATAGGAGGQQVAASGPGVVVQQPAGPPAETPSPTAYGISADGPTTDVATWLFGPRNH